jgi:hypothetical protein
VSDHLPDAGKMVCPNCGAAKWDDDEDSFVCGSHKDGYRDFQCRHREPLWRELTTIRTANAALVERVKRLEEAGDIMATWAPLDRVITWTKAKATP